MENHSFKKIKRIARSHHNSFITNFDLISNEEKSLEKSKEKLCPFEIEAPKIDAYDEDETVVGSSPTSLTPLNPHIQLFNSKSPTSPFHNLKLFSKNSKDKLNKIENLRKLYCENVLSLKLQNKLEKAISQLRIFKTHCIAQNCFDCPVDLVPSDVIANNSFDCQDLEYSCFYNTYNEILHTSFQEPKCVNDIFYKLENDLLTSVLCGKEMFSNVVCFGSFKKFGIIDTETQKLIKNYQINNSTNCLDQKSFQFFTGLQNGNINIYDFRSKNQIGLLQKTGCLQDPIISLSLSDNILLSTKLGSLQLWDLRNSQNELKTIQNNFFDTNLKKACFSNEKQICAVAKDQKSAKIMNSNFSKKSVLKDLETLSSIVSLDSFTENNEIALLTSKSSKELNNSKDLNSISLIGNNESQYENQEKSGIYVFKQNKKSKWKKIDKFVVGNGYTEMKISKSGMFLYLFSPYQIKVLNYFNKEMHTFQKVKLRNYIFNE